MEALTAAARRIAVAAAAHPLPLERDRDLDHRRRPRRSGLLGAAHAEHGPLRRGDRRAAPGARAGLPGGRPGRHARHAGQAAPGRRGEPDRRSPPCAAPTRGARTSTSCSPASAGCGSPAPRSTGRPSTAASGAARWRCRPIRSSASASGSIRRRQQAPIAPAAAAPLQAPDLADWFWVAVLAGGAPGAGGAASEDGALADLPGLLGSRRADRRAAARARGARSSPSRRGAASRHAGDGAFRIDPARRQDYDALLHAVGLDRPLKVLHLWGLTGGVEPGFAAAQTAGLVSLTLLAQAVSGLPGDQPVRLALVADGLHEVIDGDPVHPAKATVLGPLKVVHQEVTRLACGSVDVVLPARRLARRGAADRAAPGRAGRAARGARAGGRPARAPALGARLRARPPAGSPPRRRWCRAAPT